MQKVVIVGAGHAGGVAAFLLRAAGFLGSISLIGDEEWPPYERPPLSKGLLAGRIPLEKTFLRSAAAYAEHQIDLRMGVRVEGLSRPEQLLTLSDGARATYDTLVLACGGRPRLLDLDTAVPVHYLRNLRDTLILRDKLRPGVRVVIIGAGFVGLEVAATARGMQCDVVVVEAADYVLSRVAPGEIGAFFESLHRRHGVQFRLGTRVNGIEKRGEAACVETSDGESILADVVVAGIGIVPNTELAIGAGLGVDDGILTDEFGRTSDPSIYAIGDVARHFSPIVDRHTRLECWQNAQDQARAIASIIAGGSEPYVTVPWLWTDQYEVVFQSAGSFNGADAVVWRGSPDQKKWVVFYLRQGKVAGGATINNPRDLRLIRKLVASGRTTQPEVLRDLNVELW
jgi:3-phenylpropionate/trans-cinnamate dioxygenase ferredoxin reductase component